MTPALFTMMSTSRQIAAHAIWLGTNKIPIYSYRPSTDHGTLPNLRFSFSDAHVRMETGGWTRQVIVRELGISTQMAGVNMRLNAGGVRELHWHKAAEWAYMLYGEARITAIDADGRNFVDDVGVGDLGYFGSGIPHSIQGLGSDGCEFLLVFDVAPSTKTTHGESNEERRRAGTSHEVSESACRPDQLVAYTADDIFYNQRPIP